MFQNVHFQMKNYHQSSGYTRKMILTLYVYNDTVRLDTISLNKKFEINENIDIV